MVSLYGFSVWFLCVVSLYDFSAWFPGQISLSDPMVRYLSPVFFLFCRSFVYFFGF